MDDKTKALVDKSCQAIKDAGKWTKCHEKGHALVSPQDLVCTRCGEDFNELAEILQGAT